MLSLRVANKALIINIILFSSFSCAADDADAIEGETDVSLEGLHGLAGTGFTAVAFIGNDPILASMAGNEAFDRFTAGLEKAAYPCENDSQFAEFDFWIGEWDVQMANGQFAGSNVISREQRGCYLSDWTPLPDGRVRQFFEQSDDGGVTWVSWFEGFYTRKAN